MNSYLFEYKHFAYSFHIPHYRNLFNGQEADNEVYGDGAVLGFEYRMHDTRIGRWWSIDPMADKYPGVGPYVFCMDSPLILMDPSGAKIDPASQDDWNKQKQDITATVVNRTIQIVTNTIEDSPSYTKKSIMSLIKSQEIMSQMEQNPDWEFSLTSKSEGTTGFTRLTRRDGTYLFQIGYVNTANFVHEITHCGQFLNGEIVFQETSSGFGAFVDVYDELEAYQFQYYYNQSSLPLNKYPIFTKEWLRDIKDDKGNYPYRKDGIISFDKYATKEILKLAYPELIEEFDNMKGPLMCQPRTVSN